MPGHLTGLRTIWNDAGAAFQVRYPPDLVAVPPGGSASFLGKPIPWVTNAGEAEIAAILFSRNRTPIISLFQDDKGYICWTPFDSSLPEGQGRRASYKNRRSTIRSDNVSVVIKPDETLSILYA
jgi:hypothetical protein